MDTLRIILLLTASLGLLNVWIVRFGRTTAYRGGGAGNLREEFAVYGLPSWSVWVVGSLKVAVAFAFVAGIWWPEVARMAAGVLIVLMLGALSMHVKVRDPLKKSLPAMGMLAMAVAIAFLSE